MPGQTTSAIYIAPGYIFPFVQSDLAVLVLPNAITNVPRSALQLGGNPIAPETPIYIVGYGQPAQALLELSFLMMVNGARRRPISAHFDLSVRFGLE